MKSSENGRSMIEMLGVLAVVGVLSTGGIAGYIKMMAQYKINKSVEQIEQISAKLSTIGSGVESYEGLNNKSAVKFDAVPSEAIIGDGTNLENPFGGEIIIKAAGLIESSDNQAYSITYKGISEDACVALGTIDWNRGKNSNLVGMGIVTTESKLSSVIKKIVQRCPSKVSTDNYIYACSGGTGTWGLPLPFARVAKACSCDNDTCNIVFKYF